MDNDVFSLEEHLSAVNRKNAAKGWIKLGAGIAGLTATILDTYLKHGCYLTYATPTLNSRGYISGTKDTTSYYRYDTDWSYLHTAMAILSASIVVSGTFDIVIPKKRYQKREWAY
jgi:hypothetical protein